MKKNKEQLRYLPAIISLSAGLIISIVMIINRKRTLTSLIVVLFFFTWILHNRFIIPCCSYCHGN